MGFLSWGNSPEFSATAPLSISIYDWRPKYVVKWHYPKGCIRISFHRAKTGFKNVLFEVWEQLTDDIDGQICLWRRFVTDTNMEESMQELVRQRDRLVF